MTPEPRQVRCPYCLEILTPEPVVPFFHRFPDHRGHGGMRYAGWNLPVVEHDYVTEEATP